MPAGTRKHGSHWDVINTDTGKVYGHSSTKERAQRAANARNAAAHGFKFTGKKT